MPFLMRQAADWRNMPDNPDAMQRLRHVLAYMKGNYCRPCTLKGLFFVIFMRVPVSVQAYLK